MKPQLPYSKISTIVALRHRLKENQSAFWQRVGVTQCAASRYESGRPIPRATLLLLNIIYSDRAQRDALIAFVRLWNAVPDSSGLLPWFQDKQIVRRTNSTRIGLADTDQVVE